MRVDHEKLIRTLVLVRELEELMETYCKDGLQVPVPWQNVVMAVEQMQGCAIQVVRPNVEDLKALNGAMIRWDDGLVAIVLRHGLTADDQNFTIVKEAMHPLVDQDADRSADTDATIDHLFKSEFFGVGNGEADHVPCVQSEHLALIAACCILVPARLRDRLRADIDAKKTSVAKEALALSVPEHVISIAISDTIMRYTDLASKAEVAA